MMDNCGKDFASRFSYAEIKDCIYPFIRNLYSANSESLDYTNELAGKCPGLSTNGVFVFFVADMGHVIPVQNIAEEITFEMVNFWSIPTYTLYKQAMENLDNLPLRFSDVYDNLVFRIDTSSGLFPNYECSWFLSPSKREEVRKLLDDDFYIFPVSLWYSYLIRKSDAGRVCSGPVNPSFVLAYIFSRLGFPIDNLLRHGYLYEDGELKIQELTASRKDAKVISFPPVIE